MGDIRVKVVLVPYSRDGAWDYARECYVYEEKSYEGRLINVFWHPTDGTCCAVLDDCGEIDTHKIDSVTVLAEGE